MSQQAEANATTSDQLLRQVLVMNQYLWERVRSGSGWRGGDPRKSLEDECGYNFEGWGPAEYQALYDRSGLAAKIVSAWTRESWMGQPDVYESERGRIATPFEQAWDGHGKSLVARDPIAGDIPYEQPEGNPVWPYLRDADEKCGIGRNGVILHGVDDKMDLSEPAVMRDGAKLLYLRVFSEAYAAIKAFDEDKGSPRYRQPEFYSLTMSDDSIETVHWTRVTHISEGDLYHEPRLQRLLPQEQDARKVAGGSAEMFWKSGSPKYSLEVPPELHSLGKVTVDAPSIKDDMEKMDNGLIKWILLEALTLKSHAPTAAPPNPFLDAQLQMIAMILDMPMRIFMGSEQGKLAADQDSKRHNKKVLQRNNNIVTPRVILPYIATNIRLGVLPMPGKLHVWWPGADELGEQEKADKALKLSQALAAWKNSGEALPLFEYLTTVWGWEEDEAKAVADAAEKKKLEDEAKAAKQMQEQAKLMQQAQPQSQPRQPDPSRNGNFPNPRAQLVPRE